MTTNGRKKYNWNRPNPSGAMLAEAERMQNCTNWTIEPFWMARRTRSCRWTATCTSSLAVAFLRGTRWYGNIVSEQMYICIYRLRSYSCIKLNLSFMCNTLSCKFKYEFMHIAFANTVRPSVHSFIFMHAMRMPCGGPLYFIIGRQDDMRQRGSLQIFIN